MPSPTCSAATSTGAVRWRRNRQPPERPGAAPLPAPGRHAGAGQRLRVRHVSRAAGRVHSGSPPGSLGSGRPVPTYDAEVIELACIPLCWLLSSPNRFMRDWVTKALVQLLRGHLDVMHALFERFWTVDDPYIVQRVVAIAYRALLRSAPAQATQAKVLGRTRARARLHPTSASRRTAA